MKAMRINTPIVERNMTDNDYFGQVVELLRLEAEAINHTASHLQREGVESAVRLLAGCVGKVIALGAGKSGNIAQKVAATMTSTGTVSVYLHPSDAAHGGLGIVAREDIVIMFSNSGETTEIIDLLPSLQHRGARIIAIVGNINSTLARRADAVLDASVEREACPLNLAPTTSTTVALAIGDALAMTLMRAKNIQPEDFAVNHPAGRLGKRLTLRVADLMRSGAENPTIAASATMLEAVQAISRGGVGAASVTDSAGKLTGIITDGDVRRTLQKSRLADLESLTGEELMTRAPVVATPDMLAFAALRLMEDRASQISVLPVVDDEGRAVGLIRLHDIVRSGL